MRITQSQSLQKKSDIKALLAKDVPMAQIASRLHCSLRTVMAVKQGGNGNVTIKNNDSEIATIKEQCRFLNEFFNQFSEKITNDPDIMNYVIDHQETFTEINESCQHS